MTDSDKIPNSHKIDPDDFSEAHELPVDLIGTHKQLRNLQDNIFGYCHEVVQNMFDSNDKGKPNNLLIWINPHKGQDPAIVFIDHGPEGITRDYAGDIDAFLSDKKATTEKEARGFNRKGIGMFQYTNIAPKVIITSMDKEMIYKIPMFITPEGGTAYGKIVRKPITENYKELFGILSPGTIVAFHGRPNTSQPILEKDLVNGKSGVREKWTLRLFDEKRVSFYINNTKVTPLPYIYEHPPSFIRRMSGGADIRGAIWKDAKGNGHIKVFQDGYLVEIVPTEPRECTGYVECNSLPTDAGRTRFLKDNPTWSEFKLRLTREVSQFPRIVPESQDVKNQLRIKDLALKVLNLNPSPTAYGSTREVTKVEGVGQKGGTDETGYPISPEPNPDREIIPRPGGIDKPHDMDNQTTIGTEGTDPVKKGSETEKAPRSKHNALDFQDNQPFGEDKPLFILLRDRKPVLLVENKDNIEHEIYTMLKTAGATGALSKMYNCKILDWFSEINLETDGTINERIRMQMSGTRYQMWKKTGFLRIKREDTPELEV
jgi:hypothetical protein